LKSLSSIPLKCGSGKKLTFGGGLREQGRKGITKISNKKNAVKHFSEGKGRNNGGCVSTKATKGEKPCPNIGEKGAAPYEEKGSKGPFTSSRHDGMMKNMGCVLRADYRGSFPWSAKGTSPRSEIARSTDLKKKHAPPPCES